MFQFFFHLRVCDKAVKGANFVWDSEAEGLANYTEGEIKIPVIVRLQGDYVVHSRVP